MAIGEVHEALMTYDKGVPGGVATLGRDGVVEESQLPPELVNLTGNIQEQLDGKAKGTTITGTIPAAAGWYRIAMSPAGGGLCMGLFSIRATISQNHSETVLTAGFSHGASAPASVHVLQHIRFANSGISKARLVWNTGESPVYAWLEVYVPVAHAIAITVQMVAYDGWTLLDPSTPSTTLEEYTKKEVELVPNTITAENFAGTATTIKETLPISKGGTGETTAAKALASLGGVSLTNIGTAIPANADMNTYTTPGEYYSASSGISATLVNAPQTAAGFRLFVMRGYLSAYTLQVSISIDSQIKARTSKDAAGSSWTEWQSLTGAPTASPVFTGSISLGRKADTTVGPGSTAFGTNVSATASYSHSEGNGTTAANYASHAQGKHNKAMTTGGAVGNTTGDVMVIGNGTSATALSNAFRVTYGGAVYGLSAFNATGADYAEFFEWADGNPDNEDRVGYFVTLDGKMIRKAGPGDYILGIVSGLPCIIGNADEDWRGRWLHDDFNRFIKEEVATPVIETREVVTTVLDENGNPVQATTAEMREVEAVGEDGSITTETQEVSVPVFDEEGNPVYETQTSLEEYDTGEVIIGWKYKENPEYDSAQPYIERKDRQEWDCVGMLGVLAVYDDGTCTVNGYCRVADKGIATAADAPVYGETYRVIERTSESVVKVVFK